MGCMGAEGMENEVKRLLVSNNEKAIGDKGDANEGAMLGKIT